jgi:hypothetical protein
MNDIFRKWALSNIFVRSAAGVLSSEFDVLVFGFGRRGAISFLFWCLGEHISPLYQSLRYRFGPHQPFIGVHLCGLLAAFVPRMCLSFGVECMVFGGVFFFVLRALASSFRVVFWSLLRALPDVGWGCCGSASRAFRRACLRGLSEGSVKALGKWWGPAPRRA